MTLNFTPSMVNMNGESIIIIGSSGELVKMNSDYKQIGQQTKPFPTSIMSGVLFDEIWIGIWIDRELQDVRMAGIPLKIDWEDGIGRDALRVSSTNNDLDIIPKNAIWQKILNSEPMGLGKIGENIVFTTINKGIYMIDQKGEEIWRDYYPTWRGLDIAPEMNPIVSIIENDNGMVIWSAAGGIMELDHERTMKRSNIIKLKDKISNVKYSKEGGWFLMMHGKTIGIMRDIDTKPLFIETPGPVLDAYFDSTEKSWKWTGWRHDGKSQIENNIFSFKSRENIGVHISNSKVLNNDGKWEDYSSS